MHGHLQTEMRGSLVLVIPSKETASQILSYKYVTKAEYMYLLHNEQCPLFCGNE